jgi:hypothetical protein
MQLAPGFTAELSLPSSAELYGARARQADLSLVAPQRGLGGGYSGGWLFQGGGPPRIYCKDDVCGICDESGCHVISSSKW